MDCSPPGSSVRGISQARILDWVAMSSCRGSSWPRNRTCVSCTAGRFFATELPGKPWLSIGFLKQTKGTYLYLNSQKINFKFNASFLEQTMKAKSEIEITDVQSLRCVQSGSVNSRLVPGALSLHVSPGSPGPGSHSVRASSFWLWLCGWFLVNWKKTGILILASFVRMWRCGNKRKDRKKEKEAGSKEGNKLKAI